MAQQVLIYGGSGLGKTTLIGMFARYQYERIGKPIRLATCDSGLGPIKQEVQEGFIIPLCIETAEAPIPVMKKISRGEWPAKEIDAQRGLWDMSLASKWVSLMTPQDMPGGYAVEGVTRLCELAKNSLLDRQQSIGEPLVGVHELMGEKFAFQSRGTIGAVQSIVSNLIGNFRGLPVDRIMWTGHEGKGKDERGLTVLGPATIGLALTNLISGWFEITLHVDAYQYAAPTVTNSKRQRMQRRAWFENHPDVDLPKFYWPAKAGVDLAANEVLEQYFPDGYMPLIVSGKNYVQGIHTLLNIVDYGCLPGELPEQPQEFVEPEAASVEVADDAKADAAPVDTPETSSPDEPLIEKLEQAEGKAAVMLSRAKRGKK